MYICISRCNKYFEIELNWIDIYDKLDKDIPGYDNMVQTGVSNRRLNSMLTVEGTSKHVKPPVYM